MKAVVHNEGTYYPIPDKSSVRFDVLESETGKTGVGIFLRIDGGEADCVGIITKKSGIRRLIAELERVLVEVDE